MRRSLLILTVLLFMSAIGFSQTTWYVPDDFSTIQGAIYDASVVNGDTVIVRAGTYVENIDFLGKAITLTSEQGVGVTVIDGNQAGSVVTCHSGEGPDSVLDGFTITNGKQGSNVAGGMYIISCSPTVTNCTFTGNLCSGMRTSNSNSTVTNCTFTGNSASIGSGMINGSSSSPTVTNCIFTGNTATAAGGSECGGGGMANHASSPTVTNCTFSNNKANGGHGGGMLNWGGCSPTVTDCTFSGNTAGYYYGSGGGMSNSAGSSPTVTNCTFDGNSAPADLNVGVGGGMWNTEYSSPTVTQCTFTGNSAYADGGGMYNDTSSPTVTNCTFTGNSVTSTWIDSRGGGMFNYSSNLTVTNCTFTDNYAEFFGGGMYNESSSPTVTDCIFSGNLGRDYGGGMFNYSSSSPTVTNCTFTGNSAGIIGGGMYNELSSPTVTNCIFFGNSTAYGGGIYGSSGTVINCILWDNIPDEIRGSPTVKYCDVKGGYPGTGNIDADPLFVDSAIDDFHLTFNSPCKDTGDNSAVTELFDFEGDPRIAYATVDMGADEFYTHLYWTGDATPGGNVEIKFVGIPGAFPVQLWLGSGIMNPPMQTKYGDWYLKFPVFLGVTLGAIPGPDGVLTLPATLPPTTPTPLSLPLQAGIGVELTNLSVMEIQ